jgi:hypothetical protein
MILMGAFSEISEDQNTNRNVESKDCVHDVSELNEDYIVNYTGGYACYIMAKKLLSFCPCPKT